MTVDRNRIRPRDGASGGRFHTLRQDETGLQAHLFHTIDRISPGGLRSVKPYGYTLTKVAWVFTCDMPTGTKFKVGLVAIKLAG